MKTLIGFLAFVCLVSCSSGTDTSPSALFDSSSQIAAASCSLTDIQAAAATAPAGSTIMVPEGSSRATAGVSFAVRPDVKIVGPGGDKCVIIDDITRVGYDWGLLEITTPVESFTMTGLTFRGSNGPNTQSYNGSIRIFGSSKKLRISGNHFEGLVHTAVLVAGDIYGVIDHNQFDIPSATGVRINGAGEGDDAWAQDGGFGTERFVFMEDNVFNCSNGYGNVNDSYSGGRFVIRNNRIISCGTQTHPTGGSGRARGTRAFEVYQNTADSSVLNFFNFGFISSGSGVIWGNVLTGSWSNFLTLHSMRVPGSSNYNQLTPPDGYGFVKSVYDGVDSAFDQPGKGRSDSLSGAFPNVRNATKNCAISATCTPDQATEGLYIYDNQWPNPGMGGSLIAVYEGGVIRQNRDYFTTPKPGYTPYSYPHPLTLDNGTPIPPTPTLPTLSISDAQVSEGAGTATVAVTKTGPGVASVAVQTADGTASGADYTATMLTLDFAEADTTKTAVIQILQDTAVEPNETFTVNLSSPTGATILDGQGTVTIVSDDGPPVPPIEGPPPNQGPTVRILSPAPAQVITAKNFEIKGSGTDDTGIAWWEIYINDQLWFSGVAGIDSINRSWNTSPYKRKPYTVKMRGRDAEGVWSEFQSVSGAVAK